MAHPHKIVDSVPEDLEEVVLPFGYGVTLRVPFEDESLIGKYLVAKVDDFDLYFKITEPTPHMRENLGHKIGLEMYKWKMESRPDAG